MTLDFDSEFLNGIQFGKNYEFKNPAHAYEESWKNFVAIGQKSIRKGMSRAEFLDYLNEWEGRAQSIGARKVNSGDLEEYDFCISATRDRFLDDVHISMGPSRRSGGGGIWTDGWHISFSTNDSRGTMLSIHAFCDRFNTDSMR